MNKYQLLVIWLAGLLASGFFANTGMKLLSHAAGNPETWDAGYPITLLAGTVWTYIIPIVIVGALLVVSLKNRK